MSEVKSLSEYLLEREFTRHMLKAGEPRISHLVSGHLLGPVFDELATEEAHVSIGLFAMVQVTVGARLVLAVGVKGVACRVRANEAAAAADVVKQGLLALLRHRRLLL